MNTNAKYNVHYALIHALFWTAYCTGTGYMSSRLLSIGYNSAQVGIVIALCGAGSILSQSLLSGVIDRSGRRKLKPVILTCVLLAILLSAVELFFPTNMAILGICYGLNVVALQFLLPLINSMSVCCIGPVNFGLGRAIGSLTFALAAFVVGRLVTGYGMTVLSIVRICAFAAFVIAALRFPITFCEPTDKKADREEGFFKRNPGFLTLMLGCTLVYFCQTLINNNGYQIVASKGGDNTALGISLALAALIEVPVMLMFRKLLKFKSAAFWFVLSGFGYAAKAFAFLAAPDVTFYYIAQIAQLIGWPLMQVASVQYVRTITTDRDTTRGQACITATYSIALIAGSPLGGFILEYLGVSSMLLTAAFCSLAGGAIMLVGIRIGERAYARRNNPPTQKILSTGSAN